MTSQPDPREVAAVFGEDDRDALTPEEAQDLADSGRTLEEWLHPEAAARREMERNIGR
jgi:hypothetical protein